MSEGSASKDGAKDKANAAYTSGDDYDAQYSTFYEPEIRTLMALAQGQGGAVLDLCCGTGIVTVPLARTGLPVVGVDMAEAMLATAKRKAEGLANLTFVQEDVLEYDTAQRFTLALMTGNSFQYFLTEGDVAALLAKAHSLLLPRGIFIFDTRLPEGYDLTLDDDFRVWSDYKDADGNQAQFLVKQAAYDDKTGVLRFEMKDVFSDGCEVPSREILKFTPLKTLRALAQDAGFEIVGEYGTWEKEPLPAGASAGVFELRKL